MRYKNKPQMRPPFGLSLVALGVLLFLHIPFFIVMLYAFTTDEAAFTFPPRRVRMYGNTRPSTSRGLWFKECT
jgi:ABC-type spermidine/putrescine transport system permease subunit II